MQVIIFYFFPIHSYHCQVNGNQTQGENIADNGGIKESFYVSKIELYSNRK